MQRKTVVLLGFWAPHCIACITAALVLVSFVSSTASYRLSIDRLILASLGLCPVVFGLGTIVSLVAVIKFEKKGFLLSCLISNTIVLAALGYFFLYPFVMELRSPL